MYEYLVTFISKENEHLCSIDNIDSIASLVMHSDYFGDKNIRVWRLLPNRDPQPMTIFYDKKSGAVWLTDSYGYTIESTLYESEPAPDYDCSIRSVSNGDYSASCPWKASGMSVKDFIR